MTAAQIDNTITRLTDAFNANDLDCVMTFFSDDAVYAPGDGNTHRGKSAIRAALHQQLGGAYGTVRFDVEDRLIDAENRKVASRWICRHDIAHARSNGLFLLLQRTVARLTVGNRFGWHGVDVFHLDADGKIAGKYTYGWFGVQPRIERALG